MKKIIPTAGLIVFDNDQVLLVRHTANAGHVKDSLGVPAGRIDEGETPQRTALRELEEETGIVVKLDDLIEYPNNLYSATIKRSNGSFRNFKGSYFAATQFSGKLKSSEETHPEWIKISELKEENLLPNNYRAIHDALKYLKK